MPVKLSETGPVDPFELPEDTDINAAQHVEKEDLPGLRPAGDLAMADAWDRLSDQTMYGDDNQPSIDRADDNHPGMTNPQPEILLMSGSYPSPNQKGKPGAI